MNMLTNDVLTLKDTIDLWLDQKEVDAVRMRQRAEDMHRLESSAQTLGQLRYCKHLVRAVKWLRAQLPVRFDDVTMLASLDEKRLAEFIDKTILGN